MRRAAAAAASAAAVDVLKADPPPTHNARTCTCVRCDPMGSRTMRLRERWAGDRAAEAKLRAELAALPRPARPLAQMRRRDQPVSDDTRRLAQLLRAGHTSREAIEIIEAEHTQPKDPTP